MDPIKLHRPRTTPFVANSRSARCEIQPDCHLEIAVLRIVLWFEIKRVLNKPAGVEIGCPPFSSLPGMLHEKRTRSYRPLPPQNLRPSRTSTSRLYVMVFDRPPPRPANLQAGRHGWLGGPTRNAVVGCPWQQAQVRYASKSLHRYPR